MSNLRRSYFLFTGQIVRGAVGCAATAVLFSAIGLRSAADNAIDLSLPGGSGAAAQFSHQQLTQALRKRLPAASQGTIDRTAVQFMDHLRQTAPMAADRLADNKLDEDDLSSRLDIFLGDHPEFAGGSARPVAQDPQGRVAEILKGSPDVAPSDGDRRALANRFIARLEQLSVSAHDTLISGRMSDDELQARISVFVGDVRAEQTRVAVDPSLAAAVPIIDAYELANYGNSTDRPESVCYRGEVEGAGKKRDFVVFEKRPNKLRMHIVEDGIVVAVLAYDGSTAWQETPGRRAAVMPSAEAVALAHNARFDDAFLGYRERGAVARLVEKPGNGPIRLSLREADGSEMEAILDASSYHELTRRSRGARGNWEELRLSDYRKIGPLNVAFTQETWRGGVLHSTTHIHSVSLNPGLLDRFFAMPTNSSLSFMDYMGGLVILEARNRGTGHTAPAKPAAQP